jgi:hypothetical protein
MPDRERDKSMQNDEQQQGRRNTGGHGMDQGTQNRGSDRDSSGRSDNRDSGGHPQGKKK